MHAHSDLPQTEARGDLRVSRSVLLRSLRLGLVGRADVVEFHRISSADGGVVLPGVGGRWQPFPVEYKHGKPKTEPMDEVQLCGQALCLEEMLNVTIAAGALYYGKTRHRYDVAFDNALRCRTEDAVRRLRDLLEVGLTPPAEYAPKCDSCSLVECCRPGLGRKRKASAWLARLVHNIGSETTCAL